MGAELYGHFPVEQQLPLLRDAHARVILDDLEIRSHDDLEADADQFAQDALIPKPIWERSAGEDLDWEDVTQIAEEAEVHPAVVAGRWQREYGDYRRFSKMLGRGEIRSVLTSE
jgi:HTH-type transcriptional regulator / antitoxin HigA